jgi:3-oxoacyl-[acyl-carrier protein] reductase
MRELEGLAAIVTGAARNIGRAIALDLADAGAAVAVLTHSDMTEARAVAAAIEAKGGKAIALAGDITDEAQVGRMVGEAKAQFGRIDILINNAGVRPASPIAQMTLEDWHAVLAVILDGAFLCTRAVLAELEKGGRGAIVNIGGLTAYTGAPNRAHVVAAKAGLDGLTKALAVELALRGITVNLVAPGLIDTERGRHSEPSPEHHKTHATLVGRRGRPEEVAAMVRYLVGPNGRYITGQTIHISGGAYLP